MADFDPQGPADNEPKNQAEQAESCCGSGRSCENDRPESFVRDPFSHDSFVADWSGAEKSLEAQAESFEVRQSELAQTDRPASERSETFWVELVQSQQPQTVEGQSTPSTELTLARESAVGTQSEQFWADLVRSQQPTSAVSSAESTSSSESTSRPVSWLSTPPTGMGWAEDEASEWSPPEREQAPEQAPEESREETRAYEPVQSAAEPVEAEASASRDDVEWGMPASASQDWASARSEGFAQNESTDEKPSLMAAAVEAAQAQAKAKKKTAAKKPAAKKAAAKKPAKAKKTVVKKAAAKKPAAKKAVKKAAPPPKITKAPPTKKAA